MRKLLATVMVLTVALTLPAQEHYNAWFRGMLSVPFGPNIKIDNEWQYRLQNGVAHEYLPDKKLMSAYRAWLHYQYSETLKISVSPFAYFSNYKMIQSKKDEMIEPAREIRFSVAAEWRHEIQQPLFLLNRTAIEYRVFDKDQVDMVRLRNRFGFRFDLSHKWKSGFFDELFFNLPDTTGSRFFDHNRVGLNLEYQVLPHLKLEAGYLRIIRFPLAKTGKWYEHNVFLNLSWQLYD